MFDNGKLVPNEDEAQSEEVLERESRPRNLVSWPAGPLHRTLIM